MPSGPPQHEQMDALDKCESCGTLVLADNNQCPECGGYVSVEVAYEEMKDERDRLAIGMSQAHDRVAELETALRLYANKESWDDVSHVSDDFAVFEWCGDDGKLVPWEIARAALATDKETV